MPCRPPPGLCPPLLPEWYGDIAGAARGVGGWWICRPLWAASVWGKERSVSDKPSYLGLLNAIAVAESRAHCYLSAWAEGTTDPDVKAILEKVALREGEHGMAFAKRINELGYTVREKDDGDLAKQLKIA